MSAWRPTSRFGLLVAFLLVPAVVGAIVQFSPGPAAAVEPPPNIVMILTDDQRADTLRYMPIVQRTLGKHGVTFTNAYVSNPVCCPSRATIMTGLYSHSTGVYTNDELYGGFAAFEDDSTIATWLHDAGYRTGLFGKYLNGYDSDYTPPGWDRWFATHESGDYYDYSATSDGTIVDYGGTPRLRDVGRRRPDDLVHPRHPSRSAALRLREPPGAARAGDPRAGRRGRLRQDRALATPQLQRTDVKDKPMHIRNNPWMKADRRREIDRVRVRELRTLPAVDRLVGDIVDALKETGRLENTIVVFTSDNGVLWGEHRWDSKDVPYEESIAVPLIVRYDALISGARKDANLVTNLDFAPTFAELAGARRPRGGDELPPAAARPPR